MMKIDKFKKYRNIKNAIYSDHRCVITKVNRGKDADDLDVDVKEGQGDGLICVPILTGVSSKNQREWMLYVSKRLARKELGSFKMKTGDDSNFYVWAFMVKDKKHGKTRSNQSKSKLKDKQDISGQTV